MARVSSEGILLKSVMQLLQAHGFQVFRRNTGAVRATYTTKDGIARERFVRFSKPGAADIYGWQLLTGRHIEVEVKRSGQKPSAVQLEWLTHAKEDGCIAFWCDSMEGAIKGLKDSYRRILG